jgi:transposase InsO family protein
MAQTDRQRTLPCARTLQRWFAQLALPPAPAGQHPAADANRATRPHEVWQMDAAELIALRSGQRVSWLRITDEFSGAALGTRVFAEAHFNQVPVPRVQTELRGRFAVWGRPEKFRIDNGTPWGSSGDFPPDLALWLLGLGIDLIWNPPCRPDKNGVVERSQGVGKQWAEPFACDTPAELQRRLNQMDRVQREEYPSIHGQSRCQAYPDLQHSGRCYDAAWEKQHWSLERVVDYLSGYVVSRRVDRAGLVSIYNRNYYVGKHYQGQPLQVSLDPTTLHWVFADAEGRELRTHPAEQISRERIVGLQVTNRRLRKPK